MKVIQQFDHNWMRLKITSSAQRMLSIAQGEGTLLKALCGCSYAVHPWPPLQANQRPEEPVVAILEKELEKNLILVADFFRLNNIEHSVNRWSSLTKSARNGSPRSESQRSA